MHNPASNWVRSEECTFIIKSRILANFAFSTALVKMSATMSTSLIRYGLSSSSRTARLNSKVARS